MVGETRMLFHEYQSSTLPTSWLRTKKLIGRAPSNINLSISTLQRNYKCPGQGNPA